jgi:hypothetical protein
VRIIYGGVRERTIRLASATLTGLELGPIPFTGMLELVLPSLSSLTLTKMSREVDIQVRALQTAPLTLTIHL